jgi:hypothetical protein
LPKKIKQNQNSNNREQTAHSQGGTDEEHSYWHSKASVPEGQYEGEFTTSTQRGTNPTSVTVAIREK